MNPNVLIIACGALAREIVELKRLNNWTHLKIQCLPADLHNRPEKIPEAVRAEIEDKRGEFEQIFVAYADCGTGGLLDKVLAEYNIERLPGAHCYEFFAGSAAFHDLVEAEMGTFYLTDFLTRHFDRLIKTGLGIDEHPELLPMYFGNYKRLVYLSQSASPELAAMAEQHAKYLDLDYQFENTGLGNIAREFTEKVVHWQN
jgi:hypothetical protein